MREQHGLGSGVAEVGRRQPLPSAVAQGPDIDPFDLEIIESALIAIADEMFVTTQRTSQSTIIYEVLDFAVGLTDADGGLITQGNGVTLFLGTLGESVAAARDRFASADIHPGDVLVTNDPYGGGGTHLSDMTVLWPIHYAGELVAFAINKAHWIEIGCGSSEGGVFSGGMWDLAVGVA